MNKRQIGPVAVLVGGFLVGTLVLIYRPEPPQQSERSSIPAVPTVRAFTQSLRLAVTAHGVVQPKTQSELATEVAGRIVQVSPTLVPGGFFAKGDVLLEIERLDYEVALEQARAAVAAARGELANAERAHARQLTLSEVQSGSEAQLDEALNRLLLARAMLRQAVAEESLAERRLERTRLTAPYAGRVRTERVDIGQFVQRGESVATIFSTDAVEVRLPVLNDELAHLPPLVDGRPDPSRPLPRAILRARYAGADHAWPASVVRTEAELDPKTRMVNIIAQVEAPYERRDGLPPLNVGLFVEAELFGIHVEAVAVPRSALVADRQVYIVDSENRLRTRSVQVLRIVGGTAYLTSGVVDGETVCAINLTVAVEGQTVQPIASVAES